MASKEELEAMGISTEEQCTKCNKGITTEEYVANGGYCKKCMDNKIRKEENSRNEEVTYSYTEAKVLSFLFPFLGFLGTIIHIKDRHLSKIFTRFSVYGIIAYVVSVLIILLAMEM